MGKRMIALASVALIGLGLGTTAASAQSWGYDQYQAHEAYRDAGARDSQARRDQHAASEAAYYGDYAAAGHFARAADRHRDQAWNDARYARHEQRVARWNYWHGGWGY